MDLEAWKGCYNDMRGIYEEGIDTSDLEMMMGADWIRTDMFYFSKLLENNNSYSEIHVISPNLVHFLMLLLKGIGKCSLFALD